MHSTALAPSRSVLIILSSVRRPLHQKRDQREEGKGVDQGRCDPHPQDHPQREIHSLQAGSHFRCQHLASNEGKHQSRSHRAVHQWTRVSLQVRGGVRASHCWGLRAQWSHRYACLHIVDDFNASVEKYSKEPEIIQLLNQQKLDYKTSIGGKLPHFEVKPNPSLTKEKFYELQNLITKRIIFSMQGHIFNKSKCSRSFSIIPRWSFSKIQPSFATWETLMPRTRKCWDRKALPLNSSLLQLFTRTQSSFTARMQTSRPRFVRSKLATRTVRDALYSLNAIHAAHPDQDYHRYRT